MDNPNGLSHSFWATSKIVMAVLCFTYTDVFRLPNDFHCTSYVSGPWTGSEFFVLYQNRVHTWNKMLPPPSLFCWILSAFEVGVLTAWWCWRAKYRNALRGSRRKILAYTEGHFISYRSLVFSFWLGRFLWAFISCSAASGPAALSCIIRLSAV